jgi:hypothetical protein
MRKELVRWEQRGEENRGKATGEGVYFLNTQPNIKGLYTLARRTRPGTAQSRKESNLSACIVQIIGSKKLFAANNLIRKQPLSCAAYKLRVDSGLKTSEYSTPILGLSFLRFATICFNKVKKGIEDRLGECNQERS